MKRKREDSFSVVSKGRPTFWSVFLRIYGLQGKTDAEFQTLKAEGKLEREKDAWDRVWRSAELRCDAGTKIDLLDWSKKTPGSDLFYSPLFYDMDECRFHFDLCDRVSLKKYKCSVGSDSPNVVEVKEAEMERKPKLDGRHVNLY